MNQNIYYNILLNSDIHNIEALSFTNQSFYHIYQDPIFWKNKILYDFNISLDIILTYIKPITNKDWIFLYQQLGKIMEIYHTKRLHLTFDPTDNVLGFIYFLFTQGDIYSIETGEEYDTILDQLIRIEHKTNMIYFQYTEVGKRDYYTIYTNIDIKTLIEVLTIILYTFPYVKIG